MISVALVGCGACGAMYYAPALSLLEKSGQARVAALFDTDTHRPAPLLKNHFPDARAVSNFEEILTQKVDLAILASPPSRHAEQAVYFLERGVHVLCEKPMAHSVEAAERMIEASAKSRRLLAIGHFRRFMPAVRQIHEIVRNQTLGAVVGFSVWEGGKTDWPCHSPEMYRQEAAGGGILMDRGTHAVDLLCHWFGELTLTDYADDFAGGPEGNAWAAFRLSGGAAGEMRLSWDSPILNRYTIRFERGTLYWRAFEEDANRLQFQFEGCPGWISGSIFEHDPLESARVWPPRPAPDYYQAFTSQIRNVFETIEGREALLGGADEAIRSLRLIREAYRRRRLLEAPWLGPAEMTRAEQLCRPE